jgi:rhomboid family GlyGly-CTERM serine protease
VSLLLGALAVIIHCLSGAAERCQLDRAAFSFANSYRVLTCHFAHFSADHLLWDVLVFLALGSLCEWIDRRRMMLTIAASAVLIPLAALSWTPGIAVYRGLSGMDSSLFGLLVGMMLRQHLQQRWTLGIVLTCGLLVAFAMKTALELAFGVAVFADSTGAGFVPVPAAHAAGLLIGIAAAGADAITRSPSGASFRRRSRETAR